MKINYLDQDLIEAAKDVNAVRVRRAKQRGQIVSGNNGVEVHKLMDFGSQRREPLPNASPNAEPSKTAFAPLQGDADTPCNDRPLFWGTKYKPWGCCIVNEQASRLQAIPETEGSSRQGVQQ